MKQFPLVIAVLSIGLVQSGVAQSNGSPTNSVPKIQTKQEKKVEKTKVKASKATPKAQSGDKGKNTTSIPDAAYAAAYKNGRVKP